MKPNIVFILADDMGYGDMGCNNPDSKIPTPHLDRLAKEGMRFTDAHAASSVCTPSRYSLLTGRYCWRTALKSRVLWPWDPPLIEADRPTVATLLREQGYRTACIGKWHLGWEWATKDGEPAFKNTRSGEFAREKRRALEGNIDYSKAMRGGPVDRGFDSYFGVDVPGFPPYTWFEDDRLTDMPSVEKPSEISGDPGQMIPGWEHEKMIPEFVRRMHETIEQSGPDPFFLYLPLTSPHTPIAPNKEFLGKSGVGLYGDFVCEVDWVVGEVMTALERKGIAEDTLLIFSSDNGPERRIGGAQEGHGGCYENAKNYGHYSMGNLRGAKRDTWEGGHRIPFVARWPKTIPTGATCEQLVSLGDLMATCADLTNVEVPEGVEKDSASILPLLCGESSKPTRKSLVHHSASGRFALRKGDWVFIDAASGDDNEEPEWFKKERGYTAHQHPGELFCLRDDMSERMNLYGERPDKVAELSELLAQVKAEGGSAKSAKDGTPQSE